MTLLKRPRMYLRYSYRVARLSVQYHKCRVSFGLRFQFIPLMLCSGLPILCVVFVGTFYVGSE